MVTAAVILSVWWGFCGLYASRIERTFGDASPTPVIIAAVKGPFALWTALIFSTLTQPAALIAWEPAVTQSAPPRRPALPAASAGVTEPDVTVVADGMPQIEDAMPAGHEAAVMDATIVAAEPADTELPVAPEQDLLDPVAPTETTGPAQEMPVISEEEETAVPIGEHEAEGAQMAVIDPVPVRVGSCSGCGRRAFADRYGACAFCGTPLHGGAS